MSPYHNQKYQTIPVASKWQSGLAIASLIALALYLLLRFTFNIAIFGIPAPIIPLAVIIIIGGIPLFSQIIYELFKGSLGADILAAIALVTAVYVGEYVAANLIILMLAGGQALEVYATRKASSVLLALSSRLPSVAHRKIGEHIEEIQIADIKVDDHILIYPHETCPVDGVVLTGHSTMDEAYLTGEPYRISKAPGSNVLSGAINGDAVIIIRAERLAQDSRYANIMKVMQEADQHRPRLRRLGDQIGAIFAPIALTLALATWYFTGDIIRFLAVLVVATPCPLLIAIPITIISAISMAARRGIIIKDPTVLERLPTCQIAIFDKTGTLTYGKPTLEKINVIGEFDADKVLQFAASLERYSKHPLAGAILKAANKARLVLLEVHNISEKPGQGLTGSVGEHSALVTSRKKIIASHPNEVHKLLPTESGLECIVLIDNNLAAIFYFHDTPRSDSHSFIQHLAPSHAFNEIIIISGDRKSEVEYLASHLGVKETYASQSPEQKLEFVREKTKQGATLFMGDGINDAPALAAATVGVAFGQGTQVTTEAAGAVIMENTLLKVDELIHISELMRRIALQSALGGMALSLIAMGFAAAGFITPVEGAILQEVIDVLAILNALRLTWKPRVAVDMNDSF